MVSEDTLLLRFFCFFVFVATKPTRFHPNNRYVMHVQLGIFQEQEQINQYLAAKGINHDDVQIAGPFPTRLQAVEWMDFMEKRLGQGKMKRHAVGLMNQKPWYGLTFVLPKTPVRKLESTPSLLLTAGIR